MIEVYQYPHTVTPDEIDELGHANNVVYVAWMQAAAVTHSAVLGWTTERYLQLGKGWVARRHEIEYLRPAFEGDELIIETRVVDMKRVTSRRLFRILRRSDGELLARAATDWAFINYATGRPTRVPAEIAGAFPILSD
ncbi:MAG: acyl-CoA thioesterase [Planctomycetaceae bacterium]|nr:acyl-CoA thioesterase [Planctomycetaceae bacterium]